ncbi:acyltransferase family protein [Thermophilibacter provencensis]|uniref:Acyltransferase family protein n=1 Tax=Thermophilibacter provencensis TaxID=1852386 RepID=A0ABT7V5W2_9ACTN|nr:acyltransferase family protein [Thermophilibacter provencensis]MDM8271979.1 acyltransferase family protein [Thermophilibacter provencensis]
MSERAPQRRNPRIEVLRLVAIAGISVFHTFQTWFDAATGGTWQASPPALFALGLISLLGAYGNHVFFLISGYFLVPRAAAAARDPGYWADQARRTARRALPILASVLLYALLALAVSTWLVPMERVSLAKTQWLVGGLQFIWVYLAVVVATPVIGLVWAHVRRPRIAVAVLVALVFAVNAYIAFVSPGSEERGLLEWRKLMSAVSYLVAFLTGGALSGRALPRTRALLGACVGAALLTESVAGLSGNTALLAALSFKSTSLVSFALAVASLAVAAGLSADGADRRPEGEKTTRLARLACELTPSILGFYVVQSLFGSIWHPLVDDLCTAALAYGEAALLVVGVVASLVFLACVLAFDRLVRIPLLRLLHLA